MTTNELYRRAGELFGLLDKSLAFGELIMFAGTRVKHADSMAIGYQWIFTAGGKKY